MKQCVSSPCNFESCETDQGVVSSLLSIEKTSLFLLISHHHDSAALLVVTYSIAPYQMSNTTYKRTSYCQGISKVP